MRTDVPILDSSALQPMAKLPAGCRRLCRDSFPARQSPSAQGQRAAAAEIGTCGGLMVLPIALVGGATFVTAAATALSRSVLKVTEGGLRSSVHRSIWSGIHSRQSAGTFHG